jgi:hypothetical protein
MSASPCATLSAQSLALAAPTQTNEAPSTEAMSALQARAAAVG